MTRQLWRWQEQQWQRRQGWRKLGVPKIASKKEGRQWSRHLSISFMTYNQRKWQKKWWWLRSNGIKREGGEGEEEERGGSLGDRGRYSRNELQRAVMRPEHKSHWYDDSAVLETILLLRGSPRIFYAKLRNIWTIEPGDNRTPRSKYI